MFATVVRADGNIDGWTVGAPLPAPRAGAAAVFFAGSAYVIGGLDAAGSTTDTVFVGTPDPATGRITTWTESDVLKLPAPRAEAAAVITGDGIFLVGGRDAAGPVDSVWKAALVSTTGKLKGWAPTGSLPAPRSGATAVVQGTHLFVYGGEDAAGPTTAVIRGEIGTEGDALGQVTGWSTPPNEDAAAQINLPAAAQGATGFISNGIIYYVGGDGPGTLYWTIPDAEGNLGGWKTLAQRRPAGGSPSPGRRTDRERLPRVPGRGHRRRNADPGDHPGQSLAAAALLPAGPFLRGPPGARHPGRGRPAALVPGGRWGCARPTS